MEYFAKYFVILHKIGKFLLNYLTNVKYLSKTKKRGAFTPSPLLKLCVFSYRADGISKKQMQTKVVA